MYGRLITLLVIAALTSGCKLAVVATSGGQVTSLSGNLDCGGASLCEFEVTDLGFSETLTAVPAAGYVFEHWQGGQGFVCGGSTDPVCPVSNTGWSGNPVAALIVASDTLFHAMPIFRFVGKDTDGDGLADYLDADDDNDGVLDVDDACPLVADPACGGDEIVVGDQTWYQPALFIGVTWQEIDALCSGGPCTGSLNGYDLTGWNWASVTDLASLGPFYEAVDPASDCLAETFRLYGWQETNTTMGSWVFSIAGWTDNEFAPGETAWAFIGTKSPQSGCSLGEVQYGEWHVVPDAGTAGAFFYR